MALSSTFGEKTALNGSHYRIISLVRMAKAAILSAKLNYIGLLAERYFTHLR